MDRLACVNVVALPLQLVLERHPDWRDQPVAVVDRDHPNGTIEWVNQRAFDARITPGMRYAQALSLDASLQAAPVDRAEVAAGVERLARRLLGHSPHVEASEEEPGIFWLDATGLDRLYGRAQRADAPAEPGAGLIVWARAVRDRLAVGEGFEAAVVVGYGRFATWAVARTLPDEVVVFASADDERRAMAQVPLRRLPIDYALRQALDRLGTRTLGELIALPPAGVRRRYGAAAWRLYRQARGDLKLPITPYRPDEPTRARIELPAAETVSTRLVFAIKRHLDPLMADIEARGAKLAGLAIALTYDGHGGQETLTVRPASPTTDAAQVLDLVRLRLERLRLAAGIVALELTAETRRPARRQLELFREEPPRDLAAANQALARLRAELGDEAVVYARLHDAHLPEARFRWEPVDQLVTAEPRRVARRGLVRRIYQTPHPISAPLGTSGGNPSDGLWIPTDELCADRLSGPYLISGGWWVREVRRAYHFAENAHGDVVWIFWDFVRRRWFLQGEVE